jgi:hypothetical protein
MAASTQPAQTWLTKKEAAQLLDLSERQVERMAASGRVEKRLVKPGPGRRYGRMLYLEADLRAIAQEREAGVVVLARTGPVPQQAPASSLALVPQAQASAAVAQANAFGALAAHLAKLSAAFPPRTKAWLTLAEATEYSGLPEVFLADLLRTSQIDNIGRGPKTWRVRRASLDAYGAAS